MFWAPRLDRVMRRNVSELDGFKPWQTVPGSHVEARVGDDKVVNWKRGDGSIGVRQYIGWYRPEQIAAREATTKAFSDALAKEVSKEG